VRFIQGTLFPAFVAALLLGPVVLSGCSNPNGFADGFYVSEDWKRDEFTQTRPRATDILWVIDTSCSMQDEQEALADNFPAFISFFIDRELPFRMGVTSTNIDEDETTGLDGALTGSPSWLDHDSPDVEDRFIERILLGIDPGHGAERGLHASHIALTDRLSDTNAGFLRSYASLVVLVVSDEPDYSTLGYPNSMNFIDHQDYAPWLDLLKGDTPSHLSAIVGVGPGGLDDPEGCVRGGFLGDPNLEHGALRGDGYIEAAIDTGGSVQSICDADWTLALYRLGLTSAGLLERFDLSAVPVDGTIQVRVEGSETSGWSYESALGAILFAPDAIPETGNSVVVTYRSESEDSDS
jgi:hypothetical protein